MATIQNFFSTASNCDRLWTIVTDPQNPCHLEYFVTKFCYGRAGAVGGTLVDVQHLYQSTVRAQSKQCFNFGDKPCASNPPVTIDGRPTGVTLAQLAAIRWAILHDLDKAFFARRDEVVGEHYAFLRRMRRVYAGRHKRKQKRIREMVQERVLGRARGAEGSPQILLTRDYRRWIRDEVSAEKRRYREMKARNQPQAGRRASGKKRRCAPPPVFLYPAEARRMLLQTKMDTLTPDGVFVAGVDCVEGSGGDDDEDEDDDGDDDGDDDEDKEDADEDAGQNGGCMEL